VLLPPRSVQPRANAAALHAGWAPRGVAPHGRAWAQGVLPPRVFAWLWRARVRAMLRRRERHVCKLQTVSAVMARPRPRRSMDRPARQTWAHESAHVQPVLATSEALLGSGVWQLVDTAGLLQACTDMVSHGWNGACLAAPPSAAVPATAPVLPASARPRSSGAWGRRARPRRACSAWTCSRWTWSARSWTCCRASRPMTGPPQSRPPFGLTSVLFGAPERTSVWPHASSAVQPS